jgi:hypothetical protein
MFYSEYWVKSYNRKEKILYYIRIWNYKKNIYKKCSTRKTFNKYVCDVGSYI